MANNGPTRSDRDSQSRFDKMERSLAESYYDALMAILREETKARGSIAGAEGSLGYAEGGLRAAVRRRHMPLLTALRWMTDVLGLSPAMLCARVEAEGGSGSSPAPSDSLARSLRRSGPLDLSLGADTSTAALDELSHADPRTAEKRGRARALRAIRRGRGGEAMRWAGVVATALRRRRRYHTAEEVMTAALALASAKAPPRLRADLQQRAVYVLADCGNYEAAEEAAVAAVRAHADELDDVGLGRALVDRANAANRMADWESAKRANQMALQLLPEQEELQRGAAHQGLAVALLELGDAAAALEHLTRAEPLVPPAYSPYVALTSARILEALGGRDEEADTAYEEAVDGLRLRDPAEAAFAGCHWLRLLLRRQEGQRARAVALALRDLTLQVDLTPTVESLLWELERASAAGQLTAELADNALFEISRSARSFLRSRGGRCSDRER